MMKKLMFLVLVMALLAGSAMAGPDGPYRLVFITSTNIGCPWTDIADYNAHIQSLATAAGLPGTDWKVIGSTSLVDARDNTNTNPTLADDSLGNGTGVPIYLVDGTTLVASNNADLWDGSIQHIINQDEFGNTKSHWPHTGTMPDGTVAVPGNNNGKGLDDPTWIAQGNGGSTTDWIWRVWTQRPPSEQLPLYAMSEVIPEPATMVLLGLGGLTLLRRRRNG